MTIATQYEDAHARGFLDVGPRDNERAFRRAMRHSRFVRVVRVAIPFAILLGSAGAFAAYRWLEPLQALAKLPVSTEGMVISGTKIMMRTPLVKGFTKDNRPYMVTARFAAQDVTKPDTIELQEIRATLDTADQGNVQLTAQEGLYDSKAEQLTLQHNVIVRSSEFEAALNEAVVHVRKGEVVSKQPVEIRMLQGTLNANRLEIGESGKVVVFSGGVTLVIDRQVNSADLTGSVRR